MSKKLDVSLFEVIVENTPLVSLDFIVVNPENKVLLGQRLNRPAQHFWFVPGGRIRKNESIAAAFMRLTLEELGVKLMLSDANFLDVYEHFYNDNFSEKKFSTHYVVLGYEIKTCLMLDAFPGEQHNKYLWFSIPELLSSEYVHQHTKDYFLNRI